MGTMKIALEKFNNVIERYKAKIGTIGQEREAFKNNAHRQFSEIKELIDKIGLKIADLENRLQDNARLVQENAELRTEIVSLNKQLSELQREKNEIESQIKGLQEHNANLTTENSSIQEEIKVLNEELAGKNEDLAGKNEDLVAANKAVELLNNETKNNIALIETTTQQLEQELGRLNVDNNQIDIEILRKLEELKRKLTVLDSRSGAAAAVPPIFNSREAAERDAANLKILKTKIGDKIRAFVKTNIDISNRAVPETYTEYNLNQQLKNYYETLIGYTRDGSQVNLDNKGVYYTQLIGNPDTRLEIPVPTDEATYDVFKKNLPAFLLYWTATELNRGGGKKSKKIKTKGKRINKMRRTIKRKQRKLRGGWTYKGSPSLDSKSSVVTESSKSKSNKTKSRSNKIKSNKKHKSKKVIRRYKR